MQMGKTFFLRDVWPSSSENTKVIAATVHLDLFNKQYGHTFNKMNDGMQLTRRRVHYMNGSRIFLHTGSSFL